MPAGLFIYGWCGEYHTHWIFLDIGVSTILIFFGFGNLTLATGIRIRLATNSHPSTELFSH